MRIWDVSPGYLNRQSLLGEHRELHGLYNILTEGKKGYSSHPETRRWVGAAGGLVTRHAQLAAEMRLRGYTDRTPLVLPAPGEEVWPANFVDTPVAQFDLLRRKYRDKVPGRIPFPDNPQQLWAQHKYSVMARSPETYRRIGRAVAAGGTRAPMDDLAGDLVVILRERPSEGRLSNAVEHMWGHVKERATPEDLACVRVGVCEMLQRTQELAGRFDVGYLMHSTALSDLAAYHPAPETIPNLASRAIAR